MKPPDGEFSFTRLEKVVFGPGRVLGIGRELEQRGLERAVVVTGRTLSGTLLIDRLVGAMGTRCVGVFDRARQHVPAQTVRDLTAELHRLGADAVVSFGGGSPIDTAKVAAASVMNGRDMTLEAGELKLGAAFGPTPAGARELIHIAVPTTLSAGEYTPGGGATDETSLVKLATLDPRLQPKVVINDPEMTLQTPDWLWAATGMRALDHAVESAYSVRRQPFIDALATKAIRLLMEHLPGSVRSEGEERLARRGQCQIGAWCSLFGGFNTGLGVSHAMGHQIGPRWDVPHGVTSCITLPHAMRFMAGVAPERFEAIAEGMGIEFDPGDPEPAAYACAARVKGFIAWFNVHRTLREVGIEREEIASIAQAVREEIELFGSVGRPMTLEEVTGLLDDAWA